MPIELLTRTTPGSTGLYRVFLNDTLICTSRLPFYDGARMLLRLGYDADLLLTMRHQGSAYPSFVPVPIGQAAKLSVVENAQVGPKLVKHKANPFAAARRQEKVAA